ncbi:uncharacterized protein LOC144159158 isoform X2 [Haemaphysalis longicornis]
MLHNFFAGLIKVKKVSIKEETGLFEKGCTPSTPRDFFGTGETPLQFCCHFCSFSADSQTNLLHHIKGHSGTDLQQPLQNTRLLPDTVSRQNPEKWSTKPSREEDGPAGEESFISDSSTFLGSTVEVELTPGTNVPQREVASSKLQMGPKADLQGNPNLGCASPTTEAAQPAETSCSSDINSSVQLTNTHSSPSMATTLRTRGGGGEGTSTRGTDVQQPLQNTQLLPDTVSRQNPEKWSTKPSREEDGPAGEESFISDSSTFLGSTVEVELTPSTNVPQREVASSKLQMGPKADLQGNPNLGCASPTTEATQPAETSCSSDINSSAQLTNTHSSPSMATTLRTRGGGGEGTSTRRHHLRRQATASTTPQRASAVRCCRRHLDALRQQPAINSGRPATPTRGSAQAPRETERCSAAHRRPTRSHPAGEKQSKRCRGTRGTEQPGRGSRRQEHHCRKFRVQDETRPVTPPPTGCSLPAVGTDVQQPLQNTQLLPDTVSRQNPEKWSTKPSREEDGPAGEESFISDSSTFLGSTVEVELTPSTNVPQREVASSKLQMGPKADLQGNPNLGCASPTTEAAQPAETSCSSDINSSVQLTNTHSSPSMATTLRTRGGGGEGTSTRGTDVQQPLQNTQLLPDTVSRQNPEKWSTKPSREEDGPAGEESFISDSSTFLGSTVEVELTPSTNVPQREVASSKLQMGPKADLQGNPNLGCASPTTEAAQPAETSCSSDINSSVQLTNTHSSPSMATTLRTRGGGGECTSTRGTDVQQPLQNTQLLPDTVSRQNPEKWSTKPSREEDGPAGEESFISDSSTFLGSTVEVELTPGTNVTQVEVASDDLQKGQEVDLQRNPNMGSGGSSAEGTPLAVASSNSGMNSSVELTNAQFSASVSTTLSRRVKNFSCHLCPYTSKIHRNVTNHIRTHTKEKPFKCTVCLRAFSRKDNLAVHTATHAQCPASVATTHSRMDKNFSCHLCPYTAISNHHVTRHIRTHTKEKPFKCTVCLRAFSRKDNLAVHTATHAQCPASAATTHSRMDKNFSCHLCPYTAISNRDVTKHIRTHTKEKPFKCTVCLRAFSRNDNLAVHTATHASQKKTTHRCKMCSARPFKSRTALQFHMFTHTGQDPFKCNVCSKVFPQESQLERHMRIHSNNKPFKCNYCPLSFAQRSNLVTHTRLHTGERPFVCSVCSRGFPSKQILQEHLICPQRDAI